MDILVQVEAVESALRFSGYPSARIPFTRDLKSFIHQIKDEGIDVFFNLCETVDEDPKLAWHPAALFELLGTVFSGSPSSALMLTTDKLLTKQLLKANGIRTPNWLVQDARNAFDRKNLRFPVIIKPRFEDASIGIDQESIFEEERSLKKGLDAFHERFGSVLVEEYVAGREFNISLFGYPAVKVLPVAEIDFSAFPKELYPIVGYRAKWDERSFEYKHTHRIFPGKLPRGLLGKMKRTALACFRLFMLRDYGRVDMRVDDRLNIHVLEVNANPCLSPDAGLSASFQKTGRAYPELVIHLLHFTLKRLV